MSTLQVVFFFFSGHLETSKIFQFCSKAVGNSKVARTKILVALAPKIAETWRVVYMSLVVLSQGSVAAF